MEWLLLTLRVLLLPALVLLFAVATARMPHASAEPDDPPPPPPVVKPHAPFAIPPTPIRPASHYRAMEERVRLLAGLGEWADGLDPTRSPSVIREGGAAPKPGDPTAADAARELVAAGPDAIPVLLAHLDDETRTPQELAAPESFGGMEARPWIDVNPALTDEVAALHATFPGRNMLDPDTWNNIPTRWIDRHTVTVGDVCLALLGAIVNRTYESVGYRGTNITVITSPSRDPRLARVVRAQWAGKDVRAELARRLLADFHTTLGGDWDTGSGERQARAARLLLRYFERESIPLVAARLDGLVLDNRVNWKEHERTNGLDLGVFLAACSESRAPALQEALLRAALRMESPDLFDDVLRALPDRVDDAVRDRTLAMLLVAGRQANSGHTVRNLLMAVRRRWPEHYEPALRRRLADGLDGMRDVGELAYRDECPLPVEAWVPLLARREKAVEWVGVGYTHPLQRLRVCDVAALQIVKLKPELLFGEAGDEAARDVQIAAQQKALAPGGK